MGQPVRKRFLLVFVVFTCLFVTAPASAQEATLTFPHIAAGQGISVEVNLTNPAPHIEKGYLLFFGDDGSPMSLMVDGTLASRADFAVPAGGVKKFRIEGTDQTKAQVGYALVIAENAASALVGNLVFTINNLFDVSVPDSRSTNSARLFVERNVDVNSGYAILSRNDRDITISLSVKDERGSEIGQTAFSLGPGEKASRFLDFVSARTFVGNLEVSSDSPFYVMGLRQRRTGSLAALPAAVSAGPVVGSQLLYFVDTGINLKTSGYWEEALSSKKTVYELTGLTRPTNPTTLKVVNNNRNQAVTIHVYFLNDQGHDFLDFLMVLKCGETLIFDPFDLPIPGTDSLKVSNFLLGYGLPGELAADFPAVQFGSGRFVLSVLAVGALDANADNMADKLYPNDVTIETGVCGVTPRNTGSEEGFARGNLHVFNALPVAFDYLSGDHLDTATGVDGSVFAADTALKEMSAFTRTLVPSAGGAEGFVLADPGSSELLDFMAGKKRPTAGTLVIPSTAVVTWGLEPFTFLPGGR